MKIKTLAIPIRSVDFSETSQIVSLYTRDRGLLEGIAKGAYREKGSFQGPFDMGVLYEVLFLERRGAGLSILTESTVVDGFRGIRASWERQVAASHLLEFLRVVATAESPEVSLFDLVVETLGGLACSEGAGVLAHVARFDARGLRALGLLAPMDSCVQCGREWPGGDRPAFVSARAGGVVCRGCRTASPHAGVVLPGQAVRLLVALLDDEGGWDDIERSWPEYGRRVLDVLGDLRNHLLERELVALRSLHR